MQSTVATNFNAFSVIQYGHVAAWSKTYSKIPWHWCSTRELSAFALWEDIYNYNHNALGITYYPQLYFLVIGIGILLLQ